MISVSGKWTDTAQDEAEYSLFCKYRTKYVFTMGQINKNQNATALTTYMKYIKLEIKTDEGRIHWKQFTELSKSILAQNTPPE